MKNDKCNACSGFPTGGVPCEPNKFTQAVVEINNPKECPILFHKVVIPVTMGDETSVPPEIGKYRNVLLVYEINNHSYLYSSDGVPTRLNNGITNYEEATNLPQINGVTLRGNKSAADLNLADAPMVITVADGNTSWSGADTAEDVYNFFLNKGKVNIIFNGGENYAYEIASAGYIPEEEKMMCTLAVATITTVENTAEFEGNALFGTMTLYTADKAIDVSQIELQPKLFVTDFTGLDLNYNELSGVPATTYSIGMVKPGSGLSVDSDGTLSADGAIIAFDTVADMKLSEDLSDGEFVETYGFYAKGDGGGAKYKVRILTGADTVNEMSLIALSDDNLVAELMVKDDIRMSQLGASTSNPDSSAVLVYALSEYNKICIDNEYKFTTGITITSGDKEIYGYKQTIQWNGSGAFITITNTNRINIHSVYIKCLNTNIGISFDSTLAGGGCADCVMSDITIYQANKGIVTTYMWDCSFNDVRIQSCIQPLELGNQTNAIAFNSCRFVSFSSRITLTNCENIEFNNCDISNYSGEETCIRLYQSSLLLINCYYENIGSYTRGANIDISASNTTTSMINIIGGKCAGNLYVYPSNGILYATKLYLGEVIVVPRNISSTATSNPAVDANIVALSVDYSFNRYNCEMYFDGKNDITLTQIGGGTFTQTFTDGQKELSHSSSDYGGFSLAVEEDSSYLLDMEVELPSGVSALAFAQAVVPSGGYSQGVMPINGRIIVPFATKNNTAIYVRWNTTGTVKLGKLILKKLISAPTP